MYFGVMIVQKCNTENDLLLVKVLTTLQQNEINKKNLFVLINKKKKKIINRNNIYFIVFKIIYTKRLLFKKHKFKKNKTK